MALTNTLLDSTIQQLQQAGRVHQSGQFIVLFAHQRWHLMTTQHMGKKGTPDSIQTVHFMDETGARRYFKNYTQAPTIQSMNEMFLGFSEEVAKKVLPTAQDYLPLLEAGLIQASTGYTSDTITTSTIGARGKAFIKALQPAMDQEVLGFALQFTH